MTSIPDKLYFKIGEVSEITGLEAYVLRFWETEFKKINPKRTESGQRLYSKKDVELILTIKTNRSAHCCYLIFFKSLMLFSF